TGFLQNDASWRSLPRLAPGELRSPFYLHVDVEDRPGVLAHVAERLAAEDVSVARLTQRQLRGSAAPGHTPHQAAAGRLDAAVAAIAALKEVRAQPTVMRVIGT